MISIIICSRKSDIPKSLKQNIEETIGIENELVVIDNSKDQYSIFSAYNEGVRRSKYPYLCFMHDDILYHTQDWGKKVIYHFKDQKLGIIGVAGGHYLPNCPCSWPSSQVNSINILQSFWENGNKTIKHLIELDDIADNSIDAVAVDGVWFCINRDLFKLISFDEITFKDFHFYDLDICLQARREGYKVKVVSDILLEHFSFGNCDNVWMENSIIFYNKWKDNLPQIAGVQLSEKEAKTRELFVQNQFSQSQEIINLQTQIQKLVNSKAYKLGKFLLTQFSFFNTKK